MQRPVHALLEEAHALPAIALGAGQRDVGMALQQFQRRQVGLCVDALGIDGQRTLVGRRRFREGLIRGGRCQREANRLSNALAARGIGRGIALELARAGCRVAINSAGNAEAAAEYERAGIPFDPAGVLNPGKLGS